MYMAICKIAPDYMPKSFWYNVVYQIIVATLPRVIIGLLFFIPLLLRLNFINNPLFTVIIL